LLPICAAVVGAHAMVFEITESAAAINLPRCEDPDERKFLEPCRRARASHLVTRDKALLRLARQVARAGRFDVLASDAFLQRTQGSARD
jgi:predicted nucleic acid-binding protein